MGRVGRLRKRKRKGWKATKLGADQATVELRVWLAANGWRSPVDVEVAEFPTTGRGVMANRAVAIGDVIARVPMRLLLTVHTASTSTLEGLFSDHCWNPQQVLSALLVWERHLKDDSFWFRYLNVLPVGYDSPVFTGESDLPRCVSVSVTDAVTKMKKCYRELSVRSAGTVCFHCKQPVESILTEEAFVWGWFTVNSRCVYIPPEDNLKHGIRLDSPDCLALVPFLDFLNHSDDARVEPRVADGHFELVTQVPFAKHSQIFIRYGDHCNLKLYLEYGFIVPDNPNDMIDLTLREIVSSVEEVHPGKYGLSEKKSKYLESYNLTSDLVLSYEGFSWCCLSLINVLRLSDDRLTGYCFLTDLSDEFLISVCQNIVNKKYEELDEMLASLTPCETPTSNLTYRFILELFKVLNKCRTILNQNIS